MITSWLERILRHFLREFVDLDNDVSLSFWRGSICLRDLNVKEKALANLGYQPGRVRQGLIGKLEIHVPLTDLLYSGKLEIIVDKVYFEFEHFNDQIANRKPDDEIIVEMKQDQEQAINVRVEQYNDYLSKDGKVSQGGFRYRLYRKILHNFKVKVSDVTIINISERAGLITEVKMQELGIHSTDSQFTVNDDFNASSDQAMYKLARLTEIGIRMCLPDARNIEDAEHVMTPFTAELKVTHRHPQLKFRLEVATKEYAGLVLRRSQVKRMRTINTQNQMEWQRLREYIVSPEEEEWILRFPEEAKEEYRELYCRHIAEYRVAEDRRVSSKKSIQSVDALHHLVSKMDPLSEIDLRRKLKLEFVMPIRVSAKIRCLVAEEMKSVVFDTRFDKRIIPYSNSSKPNVRSTTSLGYEDEYFAVRSAMTRTDSISSKLTRTDSATSRKSISKKAGSTIFTDEELNILAEMEAQEASVQMPSEFIVQFVVGKLAFDMVDDRWHSEVRRNVFSVSAETAKIEVYAKTRPAETDGDEQTAWSFEISLTACNALHASEVFISFAPDASFGAQDSQGFYSQKMLQMTNSDLKFARTKKPPRRADSLSSLERQTSDDAKDSMSDAFHLEVSMVDPSQLNLWFDFEPVEVRFIPGVLDQIVDFLQAPPVKVDIAERRLKARQYYQSYLESAKEQMQEWIPDAQSLAAKVYEAIPLRIDLRLNFASPIVQVPVEVMASLGGGPLGTSVFTLGELAIATRKPCPYYDLDLDIELRNAALRAETLRGERFDMIQPTLVKLDVTYKNTEEAHLVGVHLSWEKMVASMSPQALQLFFNTPLSMLGVMWQKYEDLDDDADEPQKYGKEDYKSVMQDVTACLSGFGDVIRLERLRQRIAKCVSIGSKKGFEEALAKWLDCLKYEKAASRPENSEAVKELKRALKSLHKMAPSRYLDDHIRNVLQSLKRESMKPLRDIMKEQPSLRLSDSTDFADARFETAEEDAADEPLSMTFKATTVAFAKEMTNGTKELLEAAHAHVEKAKSKPMKLEFTLCFEETDLTLSDSIDPVMRFHGEMRKPGLVLDFQNSPKQCILDIGDGILEWDYLNLRTGVWEPFGERFHLNLHLVFQVAIDNSRKLNLVLSGRQPLMLNLKPSAVQRIGGMLPEFGSALSMGEALEGSAVSMAFEDKYRLMNLAGELVEMEFRSKPRLDHCVQLRRRVVDGKLAEGHRWTSITPLVLDIFATSVVVRAKDVEEFEFTDSEGQVIKLKRERGVINQYVDNELAIRDMSGFFVNQEAGKYVDSLGEGYFRMDENVARIAELADELFHPKQHDWSDPLSLERPGVVTVPGKNLVVELLVPEATHRLLLVTTPLRVHNKTDLTLCVRFLKNATPLRLKLDRSSVCDAFYLNNTVKDELVLSAYEDLQRIPESFAENSMMLHSGLLLPPNSVCAVPMEALSTNGELIHTSFSVTMAWLDVNFCKPVSAGMNVQPRTLLCPCKDRRMAARRDMHLICESASSDEVSLMADSVDSVKLTTISLRPTLGLRNALPTGTISVGVAIAEADNRIPQTWYQGRVPRLACLNLYNFPGVLRKGLWVRASLEDSRLWSDPVRFSPEAYKDADSGQTLQLKRFKDGAAAGISVEAHIRYSLRFSCPNWFVDRSGLTQKITLLSKGRILPCAEGITLLPAECYEEHCEMVLCGAEGNREAGRRDVRFHPSFCILPWVSQLGAHVLCVQCDQVNPDDILGAQCNVLTLRPRLVLTNSEQCDLELLFGEGSEASAVKLMAGRSLEVHWPVQHGDEDSPSTSLRFRPLREKACQWSGPVVCGDRAAGAAPFLLSGADREAEVWTVEVAPVRGALAIKFLKGSDFVVVNKTKMCRLHLCPLDAKLDGKSDKPASGKISIMVPSGGEEVPYGWYQPHETAKERALKLWIIVCQMSVQRKNPMKEVLIDDVRAIKDQRVRAGSQNLAIALQRQGSKFVLSVDECESSLEEEGSEDKTGTRSFEIELKLSKLSLCLIVEDPKPQEIMFIQLDLFRLGWRRDISNTNDEQQLGCAISEVHVDCQLPGRVDALSSDIRRDKSLGLIRQERPVVIFANHGIGKNACFEVNLKKKYTTHRDLVFPALEFSLDAVDVTIDDEWLTSLVDWCSQCSGESKSSGVALNQIRRTAGKSITEGYVSPAMPYHVAIDVLRLSRMNVTVWCSLRLNKLRFLPLVWQRAIQLLSFSRELRLDGAALLLEPKSFFSHCGSLQDLGHTLLSEYQVGFLQGAASALGKSSLVRLPRAPIKLGGTALSHFTEGVAMVAGETASLLNRLTGDDEFVARQRQVRSNKHIKDVKEGMAEAGKSLAEGVEGFFDIFTKPYEGVKDGRGLPGFMEGVGKGVLGTFVKPISGLGQAVSDVGAGISAQVSPDTASMKRRRARVRQRLPRLLFGQRGAVHPWSQMEAELFKQFGVHTNGIEEWLHYDDQEDGSRKVMMLFPDKLMVAELEEFEDTTQEPPLSMSKYNSWTLGPTTEERTSSEPGGLLIGTSPSASSSATLAPAGGLLSATQESADKLIAHSFKPLNTLLYAYQDLGGSTEANVSERPHVVSNLRELHFKDIDDVKITRGGWIRMTEHLSPDTIHKLPVRKGDSSESAIKLRKAVMQGVKSAQESHNRTASWEEVQLILRRERRLEADRKFEAQGDRSVTEIGQRILEVFELERKTATGRWATPFLPIDRESSYRWVDALGWRHPHLKHDAEGHDLSKEEIASSSEPPVELEHLFKVTSNWQLDIVEGKTDLEGWRYSTAWCASTWDPDPGLFNNLRKRRWYRTYE